MTAKEQLLRAIDDLSEAEAADVLQILTQTRDLDGQAATAILDGIEGAFERAHVGLEQAREGQTTSLSDLHRGSS